MAATQGDERVSLKLVVNKDTNKVLFAEAGKDFVDVLFSFLTLPLGTIARLVEKDSNLGAVTIGFDKQYLLEGKFEVLLQPRNSSEDYCNTLELKIDDTDSQKYLLCSKFDSYSCDYMISSINRKVCWCGNPLTRTAFLKHMCDGFVSSTATFVITDDLIVIPNAVDYTTTFVLLQDLGIKSLSSVKEITVNVTMEKALDLLKCCLLSKSSLTGLLLEKKQIIERSSILSCNVDVENSGSVNIKLKLVIRKSDGKILYAQGDKDFADLLLSFLTFPLGGVVRMLEGNCSTGSIDGLYKSIVDLNENIYFKTKESKNRLVDPPLLPLFKLSKQIFPILKPNDLQHLCLSEFTKDQEIVEVLFSHSNENKLRGGFFRKLRVAETEFPMCGEAFVKRTTMYVATDELVLAPYSSISILNLLNSLNTPFNDMKEKVVTIGVKECLSILKASLTSTSALTNGLGHLLAEDMEEK